MSVHEVYPVAETARPRRPLVIERPELQTVAQRYGYLSVTFLFWVLWLYLVVPLISLLAWVAGLTVIYESLIQQLAAADLLEMLKVYGIGIAALTGSYLTWAVLSYHRWRHVERRREVAVVDDERLASSHHLTLEDLAMLRGAQRYVVPATLLARMFDSAPIARIAGCDADREAAADDASAAVDGKRGPGDRWGEGSRSSPGPTAISGSEDRTRSVNGT